MTKQEQIEAMAHIMCEYYNKGFCAKGDITEICEDMPYCCYKNDAEALYDAGYRKVDEQRKQAVKEFAEKLKKRSYCDNVFMDGKWHRYVFVDEIDELLEEYKNDERRD